MLLLFELAVSYVASSLLLMFDIFYTMQSLFTYIELYNEEMLVLFVVAKLDTVFKSVRILSTFVDKPMCSSYKASFIEAIASDKNEISCSVASLTAMKSLNFV